jgi:large subunit ribosomal protein L37e
MGTGTAAMGKKSGKTNMIHCRRCGKRTFHVRKGKCSSCGFGNSPRMRSYAYHKKD